MRGISVVFIDSFFLIFKANARNVAFSDIRNEIFADIFGNRVILRRAKARKLHCIAQFYKLIKLGIGELGIIRRSFFRKLDHFVFFGYIYGNIVCAIMLYHILGLFAALAEIVLDKAEQPCILC